jgi:hypothetical protein
LRRGGEIDVSWESRRGVEACVVLSNLLSIAFSFNAKLGGVLSLLL